MAQKTNNFERFWKELKRRKTIRVITVYAAAAFIILQLIDIISKPLQLPEWTLTFMIVLLCVGFIIAVLLSWIYDITPAGVKKTKPVSSIKHTDQTIITTSSGWRIDTYVSVVIILVLVAFNFISRRNLNTDISKLDKSIAVLPFINDSPSDSTTYFVNGIMDEICNNLQKIKAFSKVLPRISTEQYRGIVKPPIPKIAKDLSVNFIVAGSGQKYGNYYKVGAQLIAGKTNKQLWTDSYERKIRGTKDIYEIQNEIAQSIASALKATITPEEKQRIEKPPTASLTAYYFYQKGKEEERKFSWTTLSAFSEFSIGSTDNPSNLKAIEIANKMYNTALKYDSTFALAYVGLASVYWNKNYYKEYFSGNFLDSVLILADKALLYDDQLSEAYTIKGNYYNERTKKEQASEEFDKAIKFNPNDWMAYVGKGDIKSLQIASTLNHGPELPYIIGCLVLSYTDAGFIEIAKNNLEYLKLIGDPIQYFRCAGYSEAKQGHGKKALEFYSKLYDIDSTYIWSLEGLGELYSFNGQFEESLKYYKKLVERQKESGQLALISSHRIGYVYFKNGYKKEAEYYFDKQVDYCNGQIKLNRPWAQELYPYYDLAGVYAFRGDKVKAYKNLKIYNQRQEPEGLWMVSLIKTDPLFNSIRNEPEFQQIVRDVEARYQAYHESVKKWLEEQGMQ